MAGTGQVWRGREVCSDTHALSFSALTLPFLPPFSLFSFPSFLRLCSWIIFFLKGDLLCELGSDYRHPWRVTLCWMWAEQTLISQSIGLSGFSWQKNPRSPVPRKLPAKPPSGMNSASLTNMCPLFWNCLKIVLKQIRQKYFDVFCVFRGESTVWNGPSVNFHTRKRRCPFSVCVHHVFYSRVISDSKHNIAIVLVRKALLLSQLALIQNSGYKYPKWNAQLSSTDIWQYWFVFKN